MARSVSQRSRHARRMASRISPASGTTKLRPLRNGNAGSVTPPFRPAALEKMRQPRVGPSERCLPLGFPIATLLTPVTKFIQSPTTLVMLIEEGNAYRQIYLDGRPLPRDPQPSWFGYSTGNWDGDTLVVDTNGLNDKTFLDGVGHPRSESMHITERYHRRDVGHLDVQLIFDDPVYYTKPWEVTVHHFLQADSDILEYICEENEKDRAHLTR
jgi:hypothetical protein